MLNKRFVFFVIAALLLIGVVVGQEILTNDSVIEMVTAGLPDEIIIAKITSSKTSFDLSTPALAKLTQSNVSTAIAFTPSSDRKVLHSPASTAATYCSSAI